MKSMSIALVAAVMALLTCGCSDSGISYPTGDGGWQVGLTLSGIPPRSADGPFFVSVRADAINLTTGERSPDGDGLVFCTSGGTFVNGSTEIELPTVDGRADTELEIELPGTYQVTVEYPEGSCSASSTFSVGLE